MSIEMIVSREVAKKPYVAPKLASHGNVAELTKDLDGHRHHDDVGGCASHLFDHKCK